VDRVLWLTPVAARARLTQPHDRPLVEALLAVLNRSEPATTGRESGLNRPEPD
jgi:8-oxo-dGTP diphosphatase